MKKVLAPLLILVAGFGLSGLLLVTGPKLQPRPPDLSPPSVRVVSANPESVQHRVITHGTVVPRTESDLVPEVSGRVIEMSPSLVSGGFFSKGEILLRIEPLDYEVALQQARAVLARSESDLTNTRKNHERQLDLSRTQATSASQRDDTLNKLRIANATLQEAQAKLARAQRDLQRTSITAPYDGRVRSERVDVGQFITRGVPVATIYAVDFAEVKLPIHDEELAFLDLSLAPDKGNDQMSVPVTLRARFAGKLHEWQGQVVRTEGELDPKTRMVNVIASVANPYGTQPPLSLGLFVEAEVSGSHADNIIVLPRSALRGREQVFTVDENKRLRFRDVEVIRTTDDQVFIGAGLQGNELVCISPLESPLNGMAVQPVNEDFQTVIRTGNP